MTDSMLDYYKTPELQMVDWKRVIQDTTQLPYSRLLQHVRSISPLNIQIRLFDGKNIYTPILIGTYVRDPIGSKDPTGSRVMYTWKSFHGKSPDFAEPNRTRFTLIELRNKLIENLPKGRYSIRVEGGTWPYKLGVYPEFERYLNGYMVMKSYTVYSKSQDSSTYGHLTRQYEN